MPMLFKIDDVFEIRQRGVVVGGTIMESTRTKVHIGDSVELRRHDGSSLQVMISGLSSVQRPDQIDILLRGLTKSDVQVGDEAWTIDSE